MKKVKKGFTLVELSIVLVIIGLLIGGILVGQSLIDSAKINQAVRQIQQYDIAVSNFQQRFRQLPGDSDLMTPSGNNDGTLSDAYTVPGGVPVCGVATCRERMSFWKHLSDVGMINKSYSNQYTSLFDGEAGVNVPEFLEATLGLPVEYNDIPSVPEKPVGNFYGSEESYIEPAAYVISLDNKIDDGVATSGNVRSEGASLDPCTIDDTACGVSIIIMSTNGQPLNN